MTQALTNSDPINQACVWAARLWADDVSEQDKQAFQDWLDADPIHQKAWQQVVNLQQQFNAVPDRRIGSQVLQHRPGMSRRQLLTVVGIGVGVGAMGVQHWGPLSVPGTRYATAKGEIRHWQLTDGTTLALNTNSKVDVDYDADTRKIILHYGEIAIDTGKDPRPLTIVSRDGLLEPLGTRFNVQQSELETQLKVFEGRVRITPTETTNIHTIVPAGEGVNFSAVQIAQPFHADPASNLWQEGKLAVADMPLDEFVHQLTRYRSGMIRVSPELKRLTITGIFSVQDTDRVLEQLSEILPVKVSYFSPYWVTIKPLTS
ncbi:protein FecR [Methylophaga marina]|uniref:Fec operon regulator FecR n=1 Tax=Methylophaga marina TaxID=45495 RepID=A0ABN0TY43_9GAMM|nr:FecR domain-containing protein [Methylophaga marina]BDZ73899.1 protein FecR [Methylophaga marina]